MRRQETMDESEVCFELCREEGPKLSLSNNCHGCKEIRTERSLTFNDSSRHCSWSLRFLKTSNIQSCILCFVVILCIFTNGLEAATTASPDDTTEASSEENDEIPESPEIPKVVITVAGIVCFVLLGMSISKLVDYCYDRHAISDDASDISDYTKELLKAQLMLAFSRGTKDKKEKLTPDELANKYVKIWRAKAARNKARTMKREKTMAEERGTLRPGSSRVRSESRAKSQHATVSTVNEKSRPPSRSKNTSTVAPAQESKTSFSRPISAGLKSRPASGRSFYKFVPRAGKR